MLRRKKHIISHRYGTIRSVDWIDISQSENQNGSMKVMVVWYYQQMSMCVCLTTIKKIAKMQGIVNNNTREKKNKSNGKKTASSISKPIGRVFFYRRGHDILTQL